MKMFPVLYENIILFTFLKGQPVLNAASPRKQLLAPARLGHQSPYMNTFQHHASASLGGHKMFDISDTCSESSVTSTRSSSSESGVKKHPVLPKEVKMITIENLEYRYLTQHRLLPYNRILNDLILFNIFKL